MSAVRTASITAIVYGSLLIAAYLLGGVYAPLLTSPLVIMLVGPLTGFVFLVALLTQQEVGRWFILSAYWWAVFSWGPSLGLLAMVLLPFFGVVAYAGLMAGSLAADRADQVAREVA